MCKYLVHALVTSRRDYSSAIVFGVSESLLHRLESSKGFDEVVYGRRSISAVLRHLHHRCMSPHCSTVTHHNAPYALAVIKIVDTRIYSVNNIGQFGKPMMTFLFVY